MICATIIARNEARCIERCLRSVAPFVDEMLVVDTGSTDATAALATACGARVERFAWCDDFSAARNFALGRTAADWRLVIDADEWLHGGGDALQDFRGGRDPAAHPLVGQIEIVNEFDDAGATRYAPSWLSRLLPRGVGYRGRVHEQPDHALQVRRLPIRLGHDGYRDANRDAKSGRNEVLLRHAVIEHPGDAYLHYQLGKDLELQRRFDEACASYADARSLLAWPSSDQAAALATRRRHPWLHDLVVRHLYCLKLARRYQSALELADVEMAWWHDSPDYYFTLGDLLLDVALAEPARACELLPLIESSWMRCLQLGEASALEGRVHGRGGHLAAHNLAVFHAALAHDAQAAHFRQMAEELR